MIGQVEEVKRWILDLLAGFEHPVSSIQTGVMTYLTAYPKTVSLWANAK
jgi:hypothetical protein